MKLPVWLLVVSFVPLPLFAEPAFFRQSPGSASSVYDGRLYSYQATYGAEYEPYRDHYLNSEPAEGAYPAGGGGVPVPGWNSEGYGTSPYRAPQLHPYSERIPDTRYLSDPPFYGDEGYHRADVTQSRWASEWDQAYPDPRASARDSATSASGGYGFRGEGLRGGGDWNAASWRDGYRFRPLTDLERHRMDTATGWRPGSTYPFVEGLRQVDMSPPVETYGYQPDGGWLDRYYGRP
jgi:hypothetical protein